jgi:hypothetical protein
MDAPACADRHIVLLLLPRNRQDGSTDRQDSAKALPIGVFAWLDGSVTDLLLVLLIIGFFALAVLFVRFCESIVGRDDGTNVTAEQREFDEEVASS